MVRAVHGSGDRLRHCLWDRLFVGPIGSRIHLFFPFASSPHSPHRGFIAFRFGSSLYAPFENSSFARRSAVHPHKLNVVTTKKTRVRGFSFRVAVISKKRGQRRTGTLHCLLVRALSSMQAKNHDEMDNSNNTEKDRFPWRRDDLGFLLGSMRLISG